jgi:peptidoglycan hydrolase-like protein with peptidoglycan-binding domain
MFTAYPSYSRYRALKVSTPLLNGEDVYALQLGLNFVGEFENDLTSDGWLGVKTGKAIEGAQRKLGLHDDGVAGPATQGAIARRIAKEVRHAADLPQGLPIGQLAHESALILGNYSPIRSDGSYDAGLAQRNTNYHPAQAAFDPVSSTVLLGTVVRTHFEMYKGVTPLRRRWELACGSWNAPAFANYLARQEGATSVTAGSTARPSDTARIALEAYMQSATALLVL